MMMRTAAVLFAALVLAGCSESPSAEDDVGPSVGVDAEADAAVDAETVVREVDVTVGPATLGVQVLPLIRTGEALVLTLDIAVDDPEESLRLGPVHGLSSPWSSRNGVRLPEWSGLRLLDLTGDRVIPPATDGDGDTVAGIPDPSRGAAVQRMQVAYADPGVDELALFLPQGGIASGIPVIDGEPPALGDADGDPLVLGDIAAAPVYPMSTYSVDVASTTRTQAEAKKVRISLGADVLFAHDSAELTPAANEVIAAAAAEIGAREPGTVKVVGHTDSDGSDSYNRELSERRAESVAAALRGLVDTDGYPLEVSGRGEAEPVADNGSADGRAQNRRVELVIETELLDETADPGDEQIIEIDGPTATGADGHVVDIGRPWRVTAPRAFVVDGHLMVEIHTEALDDSVDSVAGPALYEGSFPRPEDLEARRSMSGVAVMNGSVGILPVLHRASDTQPDTMVPLTDLTTFSRLDGGDTRTSVLVYPRGIDVGETVTVDLLGVYRPGWRLTDIPVEQAE